MLHIITPLTETQILTRRVAYYYKTLVKAANGSFQFNRIEVVKYERYLRRSNKLNAPELSKFIRDEIESLAISPGDEVNIFPNQGYNHNFNYVVISTLQRKYKDSIKITVLGEEIPYID